MDRFSRGLLIVAMCLAVSVSVVTGRQCYSCLYLKAESSNEAVETALSALDSSSSDECKGSVNKNTPGVLVQDCPPAATGNMAMCGKAVTTLNVSVSSVDEWLITTTTVQTRTCHYLDVDVNMDVVFRGCIEEASNKQDGCEQPDEAYKTSLQAMFASVLTISSVEGEGCGCSTDLCNGQQRVTAETLCWLVGLLLVFNAPHLW